MTKLTIFSFALAIYITLISAKPEEPRNPPSGNTGAPGETTCQQSGCHNGGAFTGTVELDGIPDTVQPSLTYAITIKVNSADASLTGFQITCLDGEKNPAGTFNRGATNSGVNVITAPDGRRYARQANAKVFTLGQTTWTFNWIAPDATPADTATFYFTSLLANGDGTLRGDNVIKSTKKIFVNKTVSTENLFADALINFDQQSNALYIHTSVNEAVLTISTISGQLITKQIISAEQVTLPMHGYQNGCYVVSLSKGNQAKHQKIIL